MAKILKRIVEMDSFSVLQEKLETWLDEYHTKTNEENVERCFQVIELNSRIQTQLFRILQDSFTERGDYNHGTAAAIRSRLLGLPWMSNGLLWPSTSYDGLDATLKVLSSEAAKDRELEDVQDMYEKSIEDLEAEFQNTRNSNDRLKIEIATMEVELIRLRSRSHLLDSYERQIRSLRSEIMRPLALKSIGNGHIDGLKSLSPPSPTSFSSPTVRPQSSLRAGLVHQNEDDEDEDEDGNEESSSGSFGIVLKYRRQKLLTRFNDLFVRDRFDVYDILNKYSRDQEKNKKIVFAALQESFSAARLSFINFKIRTCSTLAPLHSGPGSLGQAVQDYINRNPDLYSLSEIVSDVVRSLERRRSELGLDLDDFSFIVIQSFIHEACRLAWGFSSLTRPFDISMANSYELYDENKYRRSFDSDFDCHLVSYHIWPCLMRGNRVIVKGEVSTTKDTSCSCINRGRRNPTQSLTTFRSRRRSSSLRRTLTT